MKGLQISRNNYKIEGKKKVYKLNSLLRKTA